MRLIILSYYLSVWIFNITTNNFLFWYKKIFFRRYTQFTFLDSWKLFDGEPLGKLVDIANFIEKWMRMHRIMWKIAKELKMIVRYFWNVVFWNIAFNLYNLVWQRVEFIKDKHTRSVVKLLSFPRDFFMINELRITRKFLTQPDMNDKFVNNICTQIALQIYKYIQIYKNIWKINIYRIKYKNT